MPQKGDNVILIREDLAVHPRVSTAALNQAASDNRALDAKSGNGGVGAVPPAIFKNITDGTAYKSTSNQFRTIEGDQKYQYSEAVEDNELPVGPDERYEDCFMYWDIETLASDGYVRLKVVHGSEEVKDDHEWILGRTEADGYSLGGHGATTAAATQVFAGRLYNNGDVTDTEGDVVGSWY
jgi:hypothetical protein